MGNPTLKILVSLMSAGAVSGLLFLLLETLLSRSTALFRFQLSSMAAMGVFAGLAIVIFVRLSRSKPSLRK